MLYQALAFTVLAVVTHGIPECGLYCNAVRGKWAEHKNAQCYGLQFEVDDHSRSYPKDGNRIDNPIFNGGGSVGSLTLEECAVRCEKQTGCVGFEWNNPQGLAAPKTTKANCALAWACSYVEPWSGGNAYKRVAVIGGKVGLANHGTGFCKSGYVRGWDGQGLESAEECKKLCLEEPDCTYAAYAKGSTCSRYNGNDCELSSNSDYFTWKKTGLARKVNFTGRPRKCIAKTYNSGKCTLCPAHWYQSCPDLHSPFAGVGPFKGEHHSWRGCGFLQCELVCKISSTDYGCGCNAQKPTNGYCAKLQGSAGRRRALEALLDQIEGTEDSWTELDTHQSA